MTRTDPPTGATMRAVVQDRYGSADDLHLAQVPRPEIVLRGGRALRGGVPAARESPRRHQQRGGHCRLEPSCHARTSLARDQLPVSIVTALRIAASARASPSSSVAASPVRSPVTRTRQA